MSIERIIDIDERATWPTDLSVQIDAWAAQFGGTTEYTNDLPLPLEYEDRIRDLLTGGRLLRTYHCTRLLPHEVQMVLKQGLRPLSSNLMRDRIDAARAEGFLAKAEANEMHNGHVFAAGEAQYRKDRVCLILSRSIFHESPYSVEPLLSSWGGEALSMSSTAVSLQDRLKNLGSPCVVTAMIDVGGKNSTHRFYPSLHKAFVGAALGLLDFSADIHFFDRIGPDQIECVWQSGDSEYESLWSPN